MSTLTRYAGEHVYPQEGSRSRRSCYVLAACPRRSIRPRTPHFHLRERDDTVRPPRPHSRTDMDQMQRRADNGDAPESGQGQQQSRRGPDKDHHHHRQQPPPQEPSSLNPAAARLLREAIVSQPAPVTGSSDILAFARSVDRADTPLE